MRGRAHRRHCQIFSDRIKQDSKAPTTCTLRIIAANFSGTEGWDSECASRSDWHPRARALHVQLSCSLRTNCPELPSAAHRARIGANGRSSRTEQCLELVEVRTRFALPEPFAF